MLLLDRPRLFDGQTIRIPVNNRGRALIHLDSEFDVSYVPQEDGEADHLELLISPIERDYWADLWRVTATLNERPGVIHDLLCALAKRGLRIVTAETTIVNHGTNHMVELLVHARKYTSTNRDRKYDDRIDNRLDALPDLHRNVISEILKDLVFLPKSNNPEFQIRRVKELFHEVLWQRNQAGRLRARTTIEKLDRERELVMHIPGTILPRLCCDLYRKNSTETSYVVVSDTKDRYLRVIFFTRPQSIVPIQFKTVYQIGALAGITKVFSDNNLNILTFYRRTLIQETRGIAEFILQTRDQTIETRAALKEKIRSLLKDHLGKYYVNFRFSESWEGVERWEIDPEPLPDTQLFQSDNISYETEFAQANERFQKIANSTVEPNIRAYATRRAEEESPKTISIFVSRPYLKESADLFLMKSVENHAASLNVTRFNAAGFNMKISEPPTSRSDKPTTKIENVLETMSRSKGFLGIWDRENGFTVKTGYVPSSWLLFEFGAAKTLGLPCALVIRNRLAKNVLDKIENDALQFYHDRHDMDEKLEQAMEWLSNVTTNRFASTNETHILPRAEVQQNASGMK